MTPQVLFVITSDPRSSHRPAEAIRIAAGVSVWQRSKITVYLRGPAILSLSPAPEALVDAECFSRYLPILAESGQRFQVQAGSSFLSAVSPSALPWQAVSDPQLADLSARSTYLLHF